MGKFLQDSNNPTSLDTIATVSQHIGVFSLLVVLFDITKQQFNNQDNFLRYMKDTIDSSFRGGVHGVLVSVGIYSTNYQLKSEDKQVEQADANLSPSLF